MKDKRMFCGYIYLKREKWPFSECFEALREATSPLDRADGYEALARCFDELDTPDDAEAAEFCRVVARRYMATALVIAQC